MESPALRGRSCPLSEEANTSESALDKPSEDLGFRGLSPWLATTAARPPTPQDEVEEEREDALVEIAAVLEDR